jgi:ribosomal protein L40E
MVCEKCSAQINETAKFCSKCGQPVAEKEVRFITPKEIRMKTCPSCGTENSLSAKFCKRDGTKLPEIEALKEPVAPKAVVVPPVEEAVEAPADEAVKPVVESSGHQVAQNICPKCNASHAPDTKFCPKCGRGVSMSPQATPSTQTSRTCPTCGLKNPDDAKFCMADGTPLASSPATARAPDITGGEVCPQCKTKNKPGAKFCSADGFPLMASPSPDRSWAEVARTEAPKAQPTGAGAPSAHRSSAKWVIAIAVGLLGAAAGGYYFYAHQGTLQVGPPPKAQIMPVPVLPQVQQKNQGPFTASSTDDSLRAAFFCGIWEYDENGAKSYFKITKEKSGRFEFLPGFKYEGEMNWQKPMLENADGIYLKLINGKLKGEFVSSNFYATHGLDFTYRITLDIKSNNKLLYSVWSSIRGETDEREATKISD